MKLLKNHNVNLLEISKPFVKDETISFCYHILNCFSNEAMEGKLWVVELTKYV